MGAVFVGAAEFDILLGDVRSLKQKRAVVRPILAALRRQEVAAAEVRYADRHRRAVVAAATVAPTARMCTARLDRCEELVAGRPEVELLSVRRRLFGDEDDE